MRSTRVRIAATNQRALLIYVIARQQPRAFRLPKGGPYGQGKRAQKDPLRSTREADCRCCALADQLAKPYERVKTSECREKFITVQKTIEAIDLALADEKQIANASRTPMGGEMVTCCPGDFYNRG